SLLLSNSCFGVCFRVAFVSCSAGWGLYAMSLTAFWASAGFSAAGNGVAFSGPTALRPPLLSAGFTVAPGVRICTPMLFPLAAGVAGVLPDSLVTADPVEAAAPAAGTS